MGTLRWSWKIPSDEKNSGERQNVFLRRAKKSRCAINNGECCYSRNLGPGDSLGELLCSHSCRMPPSISTIGWLSASCGRSTDGSSVRTPFSCPVSSSECSSRGFDVEPLCLRPTIQYSRPSSRINATTPPTTPPAIAPAFE